MNHQNFSAGELSRQIQEGVPRALIEEAERLHDRQLDQIAEAVAASPQVRLVLCAGPSSSGKTTFSHRLCEALRQRGKLPHAVELDNYFIEREFTPLDENGEKDYECLEALDVSLFQQNMRNLLAGEEISPPEYNFLTGKREFVEPLLRIGEQDILVIEGLHGLNDRLSDLLPSESKFFVYISVLTAPVPENEEEPDVRDVRLLRRLVRDARTRGYSAEETLGRWASVCRGEDKYILPFRSRADARFDSGLSYELSALRPLAEPLLRNTVGYEEETSRLLSLLASFPPISADQVPASSLLREFIGS